MKQIPRRSDLFNNFFSTRHVKMIENMKLSRMPLTLRIAFTLILPLVFVSSCEQTSDDTSALTMEESYFMSELSAIKDIMWDDPQSALVKADDIIKDSNSDYFQGRAKYYKAFIYDDIIQDVSEAYFHYNESMKNLQLTDSSDAKMSVLNNLGLLYQFYGQYEAAFDSFERALELADDLSTEDLSDVYYNYGVALKYKGDQTSFYKAEEAFTKSLELARQIDYRGQVADVNNMIGIMYKDIKE